ncbi:polysaccharide deacetylase family protein [uncultured Modestobacter sp.]|uniref:polysaccharide deacetylase family protein n=1 Tax=uncultured Modestobacter sp. TaxID=380048 RepID=UPI00260D9F03|nr:polysaccharide deacetylase family protein [uncultured Modestobacter sp.]
MTATVPVLMYHSISADPPHRTRCLSVHPREFAAQLGFLADNGFSTLTFGALAEALRDGTPLPERPVVLSFDDGYADFHREALPLLDARGSRATLFVTTGWVAGTDEPAGHPLDATLSWSQLDEVVSSGVEVGAHSHSHAHLDQLHPPTLAGELRDSRHLLEDRLGQPVTTLAYPFGHHSARVRRDVRSAGYASAAAVHNTRAARNADPLAVPRLTVRRSTSLQVFSRLVDVEVPAPAYRVDRTLTAGYAVVRRARYAISRTCARG